LARFGQYRLMSATGASESTSTDAALISRSVADPKAFSMIVERHATSVFRYLASRVDRASSEDLLADVFEAAFRARQRYQPRHDDALPWLIGIATNVVRHHRRSEMRHTSMLRRLIHGHGPSKDNSEAGDPFANIESRDQMQCVRHALTTLDDKHREVLVLSAGLGLSYEDIARALGIKIGTVRSRLSRARTRLRELLEADGQYTAYVDPDERSPVAEEHPR
jgi:RNA polymerase sigma factor (sigma-70 family)